MFYSFEFAKSQNSLGFLLLFQSSDRYSRKVCDGKKTIWIKIFLRYDDGYLQSCHHTSMPSGSNKFPQEKQSNAKPDSSDKRAYFTVHTRGGDENVLKRGKRTLEELNHPSSISLLYIQEKSEKSEKYGNKAFFSFFCESLSLEELGDA